MAKLDGWALLRRGQYSAALGRFKEDNDEVGCDDYLEIGLAHLYFGKAELAKLHFDGIIKKKPWDPTAHAFGGIARWMLGEHREAVLMWEKGLDCDYQDLSGGMALAILVYYGAVRDLKAYDISKARRLVRKASEHPWADLWPGPIGLFLLGKCNNKKLLELAYSEHEAENNQQTIQANFYIGVKGLEGSNTDGFFEGMKKCTSGKDWDTIEEFYLARFEIQEREAAEKRRIKA